MSDFLAATNSGTANLDEAAISEAISKAIASYAQEFATSRNSRRIELGKAYPPRITGYATPMPSVVAISFQASFDLLETVKEDEAQVREDTLLTLGGVCSCDPATNELSEIEVREREWSLKSSREGGWAKASPDRKALERQYGPGRTRRIP